MLAHPARILVAAGLAALSAPALASAAMVYQREAPAARMFLARNDGTGSRVLPGKGSYPQISPDGTKVAYQTYPAAYEGRVRILTLATGKVVASRQVCRSIPQWSPDSTRLLCETETATSQGYVTGNGLALVDAATGRSRILVTAPRNEVETFTWSPDGRRIAYSNGRFGGNSTDVFVADPDHMSARRLLIRRASGPVWGPTKIAVYRLTSRRVRFAGSPMQAIHSQIWTVNPNGGGARQLTHQRIASPLVTGPTPSVWTHGGRLIVGTIGGTDYSQIIVVNARTGAVRTLGSQDAAPVAVSSDGRTILYTEGFIGATYRTATMSITGRRGRVILRGATAVSVTADWRP